jgi:plasmid stabilization system protein ParE
MAQSRLILSDRALTDLNEIQEYVAERDGELRAAAIVTRLNRSLQSIAYMPGIGRKRPNIAGQNVLFHPVAPRLIAYTILPSKDGIYVRRIVDGRRDLRQVFRRAR